MKCKNCGRRSPESNNFCQHCGVVASDDTTPAVIHTARLTPVHTQQSTFEPARPRPHQTKPAPRPSVPRAARGGSNAFSTLLFWGFLAYGAYWFMSDDQREIREMLMEWIQQQTATQEPAPAPRRPAPVPRAGRPDPGTTAPAGGRASDAPAPRSSTGAARAAARGSIEAPTARGSAQPSAPRGTAPPERETVPALQPRSVPPPSAAAPPPPPAASDIEGLSPAQVLQRLGRPSGVVTREGVTAWTYRNGALVIYFVKDRATLKTPR